MAVLVVGEEEEHLARPELYKTVPGWLQVIYPSLLAHPRLMQRLLLYSLAYDLPMLLRFPPQEPASVLEKHHPYNRIQALLRGKSYFNLLA